MRWSMLPVSVAAHAAALVAFFIMPLAAGEDLPLPWPARSADYVIAAAVPPSAPLQRASTRPRHAAVPTRAPNRILDEPDAPGAGLDVDGALPAGGPPASGVPEGLAVVGPPSPPPPPPPLDPGPSLLRVGGRIRAPEKLAGGPPAYPEIARQARVEGLVIIEAVIDERGFVTGARVLRSVPLLDEAALAAVARWRYTPTLLNGVPVRVLMSITFNFSLGDRVP